MLTSSTSTDHGRYGIHTCIAYICYTVHQHHLSCYKTPICSIASHNALLLHVCNTQQMVLPAPEILIDYSLSQKIAVSRLCTCMLAYDYDVTHIVYLIRSVNKYAQRISESTRPFPFPLRINLDQFGFDIHSNLVTVFEFDSQQTTCTTQQWRLSY
jgi:hypothetical protein